MGKVCLLNDAIGSTTGPVRAILEVLKGRCALRTEPNDGNSIDTVFFVPLARSVQQHQYTEREPRITSAASCCIIE